MITYNEVQAVYRREKSSNELQKMEDGFYSEVRELLSKIDGEHKEYIEKLVCEIFERRRNKIVLFALRSGSRESPNMTPGEKEFFDSLAVLFSRYRDVILNGATVGGKVGETVYESPAAGLEKGLEMVRVRFMKAFPAIVGSDIVHYGPFKEGDTVTLPLQNARVLIEREVAEEV